MPFLGIFIYSFVENFDYQFVEWFYLAIPLWVILGRSPMMYLIICQEFFDFLSNEGCSIVGKYSSWYTKAADDIFYDEHGYGFGSGFS